MLLRAMLRYFGVFPARAGVFLLDLLDLVDVFPARAGRSKIFSGLTGLGRHFGHQMTDSILCGWLHVFFLIF